MERNDFEQKGYILLHLSQCESEVDMDYNLHVLPVIFRVPSLSGLVLNPVFQCYSELFSKDSCAYLKTLVGLKSTDVATCQVLKCSATEPTSYIGDILIV